jgi:hypothetical protein
MPGRSQCLSHEGRLAQVVVQHANPHCLISR